MKIIKKLPLFLIMLFFAATIFSGFVMGKYTYFSQPSQDALAKDFLQSEESYIYVDSTEETKQATEAISSFLLDIDESISSDFLSRGWKIIIGKDALPDVSDTSTGATIWDSRTILLNTCEDTATVLAVFTHEFGHYFDLANGYISVSREFSELYTLYKDSYKELDETVPEEYPRSSPQEFFASCFKEYYCCPFHLRETAPDIYDFLDLQIQEAIESPYKNITTFIGGLRYMKYNTNTIQHNIKDLINKRQEQANKTFVGGSTE